MKFIRGSVKKIDLKAKSCVLQPIDETSSAEVGSLAINFNKLVIAVGIQPRTDIIQGAKEHTVQFYSVNDAFKLKAKLRVLKSSNKEKLQVFIIGGGYGGVEVAANIAQELGSRAAVTIIDRNNRIMNASPLHNRNTAER